MSDWGKLALQIRTDPPELDIPYRDNAYLGFWDVENRVIGAAHVSTSPIGIPNRKISFTVVKNGRTVEILDEVEPGSMSTKEVDIDLDGTVRVDHPEVRAELHLTPRLPLADYGTMLPALPGAEPPVHYQQGGDMTGWVEIDGERTVLSGGTYRDRTSGYRNDVDQFPEYVLSMALFDDVSVTFIKMARPDGSTYTDGFVMTETGTTRVEDVTMTRTGSGLFHDFTLHLQGGGEFGYANADKLGTVWIPIGPPSQGPALEVMEEFCAFVTTDGRRGAGFAEQGITRKVGSVR